jgi:hypothetical protein
MRELLGRAREMAKTRAAERRASLSRRVATGRDQSPPDTAGRALSSLILARDAEGTIVRIPERVRLTHTHVIGSTGAGKSKLLEHMIRQDIIAGRGVCLLDPHGGAADSLYRSILTWLAESGLEQRRTIHLIDPNAPKYTVGFNPLARPDAGTEYSVIAALTLEAVERAWGDEDTLRKPNIRRVLMTTFKVLAELGCTLAEARYLYDRFDRLGFRAYAIEHTRDEEVRADLVDIDFQASERNSQRFDIEVLGPINRLAEFVSSPTLRAIVGQTTRLLDIRAAMDGGHIILANLQGGDRVHDPDTRLLGLLLTRFLFFHAKRRTYWSRPFFVYLDECQRYLSGEIDAILAEVRKNGVGVILAHQWLRQLGETDDATRAAILNAPTTKLVFRANNPIEAEELALATLPLNLERVKHVLDKPIVVGHQRTTLKNSAVSKQHASSRSRAESAAYIEAETYAEAVSASEATGEASAQVLLPDETAGWLMTPQALSQSVGTSVVAATSKSSVSSTTTASSVSTTIGRTETEGSSTSEGEQEALEPIYETLPTTLYSKEEELYLAAQMLLGLPDRHFVAAAMGDGGRLTRFLQVPEVRVNILPEGQFERLRDRVCENSPSCLPTELALKAIEQRKERIAGWSVKASPDQDPQSFRSKPKRRPPSKK